MKSIRQKMIFACAVVFALVVGGGAVSIWATQRLSASTIELNRITQVMHHHMQADMMHDAIRADVYASLLSASKLVDMPTSQVQKELKDHLALFSKVIGENMKLAEAPAIRKQLEKLDEPLKQYGEAGVNIVVASQNGVESATKLLPAFNEKFKLLEGEMDKAGDIIEAESERVHSADEAMASEVQLLMYSVLTAGILVSVMLLVLGSRVITGPILALSRDMGLIAHGNTDIMCKGLGRDDEIGEMADAVELFRKGAIEKNQLEEQAEENRKKAEADKLRLQQEAEAEARARLEEATAGLAAGLRQLANGDLAFELTEAFAPDFEPLRHDLNGAVKQLSATLRSVAEAALRIQTGTREINDSANDLSKRTEQQAASLEETAAALDEITSNVSSSAKRAEEAQSASAAAATSATQSGNVVSQAVDAMTRIEQSSSQVNNIIGVIDEIAFQTNLLALNAGVEAARAGDAGKGFAVVAQEVRELAQRSAQAAKEIKELISHSSDEVQGGVKLVSETGAALKTIEEYIVDINHHMDAITTAAREQSVGLSEVNTAVNQMDQVTQQNAAMVEENNASSSTLAAEAEQLRQLISQFKLGGGAATDAGTRNVAALRATASAMAKPNGGASQRPAAAPAPAKVAAGGGGWEEF